MPGNVVPVVGTVLDVFPRNLCSSFQQQRSYPGLAIDYSNGESQRSLLADSSTLKWTLKQCTHPGDFTALRQFYLDHRVKAFIFYDPFESTPFGNYDPTGTDPNGRFYVRFASGFEWTRGLARAEGAFTLIQIA